MGTHIDPSVTTFLQQTITGSGRFTGVEVGRAVRTMGTAAAAVTVKAAELGADGNNLHVQLVDPGGVVTRTQARWVDATHLKVYLRRNASAILATAQEVADAINGLADPARVVAFAGGADPVLVAADNVLAGGLDPTHVHAEHRLTPPADTNGGLFVFGNIDTIDVIQILGHFPGIEDPTALAIQVVSLDPGYEPIEAEAFTFFTATLTSTSTDVFCDKHPVLGPRQAIRVIIPFTGVVQVVVRRTERPYLGA